MTLRAAIRFANLVCISVLCAGLSGCARSTYREAADREAYCLIRSRQTDPLWDLPNRAVEPRRDSRMYVANERDCGPQPPDDIAAGRYMDQPDCKPVHYYQQIPTRWNEENPAWLDYLPRNDNGEIELTQPLAVDLGLIHSRSYQTAFESVYLSALNLSGNRFEFDTQWFGGLGTSYLANGSDRGGDEILAVTDRFGFSRNLAGGGQFATEVLNGLTWNFGNGDIQQGTAAIVSTFSQPLLRGAFRHVRLENLTQAERNLLYDVRDFARFRRQFYVGIIERYLGLLTQEQAIRNTRTNVENLRQNLEEHRAYAALQVVSQIQVDQVFQQYQSGRRGLLSLEQQLVTSEDEFKFDLGLPSWLQFEIDRTLLDQFELVDPSVIEMQDAAQELFEALVQYLPPTRAEPETLKKYFDRYLELSERVAEVLPEIESDLDTWNERLSRVDVDSLSEDDRLDHQQQEQIAERVADSLQTLRAGVESRTEYYESVQAKLTNYEQNPPLAEGRKDQRSLEDILKSVDTFEDITIEDLLPNEEDDTAIAAWKKLEEAIGKRLREEIAELYVAQTQVRLFLINIDTFRIPNKTAVTYAHLNRLDLMNSRAEVVDAFRRVEVAADALESDLDVNGRVALGSDSNSNSPLKLDSANNQYTVNVQFDGPLNRLNERNVYRASQLNYQQASRNLIATKDGIANDVRAILRRLELNRLNFQIARQQVVAAARQVDQAQIDLRRSTQADANLTIFLLDALDGLLDAKNSLIVNWVQYRIQKIRLFEALELLYLDENGMWINEQSGLEMLKQFQPPETGYYPVGWVEPDMQFQDVLPEQSSESLELSPLEPLPLDPQLIESDVELLAPDAPPSD